MNTKQTAFFQNAKLLADAWGIVPLMYGSLGLEYLAGEPLNADDIDILIPSRFVQEEWHAFRAVLEKNGYTLTDEHEHAFAKDGVQYAYAAIEALESFAGIPTAKIAVFEANGVWFRLLSLQQYLRVYTASAKDGYRIHTRNKKDAEEIALIRRLLALQPEGTLCQLYERKSTRAFEDQPIPAQAKEAILRAAVMAPTAGNQQLYTILDITDQALKEQLVKSCDNQPFIASAPMVLIFCADCRKWYEAFKSAGCNPRKPGAGDLLLAVSDANIAAQNAVAAAECLGIGSCYIGDVMENAEIHQQMLRLPRYVFPAAMLVLGYPTQQQKEREKPRRVNMRHVVHENVYREMDGAELEEMLAYKAVQRPYPEWLQAFCDRKYNSEFSREMSRSVSAYLKQFEE